MKKQIILLAMMLLPMVAGAEPVLIDSIYYNLIAKAKQAEVTNRLGGDSNGSGSYSGNVDIPPTVTYDGVDYDVTSIGDYAFNYCSGLTSVTIPNSVTSIGYYAFYNCSGLTSVTIPNSVTSIGDWAFENCRSLTSVYISDIAAWCKISFGSNPLSYAHHLYLGGEEITDLVIPNSVTSIGGYAFYGCSSLTSVTIPNSVTSIGDGSFSGCSSLTSVTIPNSVTSIGNSAFEKCSGLTSVTIPNSVTSIGGHAFDGCSSLTSITIPNSVTCIEWYAFSSCSSLTSITIPNSVTDISICAFFILIGDKAFYCENLAEVVSLNDNPSIIGGKSSGTFHLNTFNNATLYVPVGTKDIYKEKAGWKDFAFIEEGTGSGSGSSEGEGATEPERCATPTISFANGELTFSCETEDVEYVYNITTEDVKNGIGSKVKLGGTYKVSVYAIKQGYKNSNVATLEFTIGAGGEVCDVNKDGAVDVADIATIIDEMAARARMQKEAEE